MNNDIESRNFQFRNINIWFFLFDILSGKQSFHLLLIEIGNRSGYLNRQRTSNSQGYNSSLKMCPTATITLVLLRVVEEYNTSTWELSMFLNIKTCQRKYNYMATRKSGLKIRHKQKRLAKDRTRKRKNQKTKKTKLTKLFAAILIWRLPLHLVYFDQEIKHPSM